jgi:hypothetical protein
MNHFPFAAHDKTGVNQYLHNKNAVILPSLFGQYRNPPDIKAVASHKDSAGCHGSPRFIISHQMHTARIASVNLNFFADILFLDEYLAADIMCILKVAVPKEPFGGYQANSPFPVSVYWSLSDLSL